jgi:hypothetical protein
MKNNKCVFYEKTKPKIGDKLTNCSLLKLDGTTKIDLYDIIQNKEFKYTFICAFSNS